MIFGLIGFVLAVVTCGQALAAMGPNDVSMGVFSIPLPGCAPEVTISEKDTSSGCYTMTIQNKTLQNGVCSSSGITPTTKQVCDGKDGAGGGCDSKTTVTGPDSNGCYTVTYQKMKVVDEECVEDGDELTYTTCDGATEVEDERYVPYPLSETYERTQGLIDTDEIGHEGYRRLKLKFKSTGTSNVLKFPDYCKEDMEDGLRVKKCTAQGDATGWPDSSNPYSEGEEYIIPFEQVQNGYPQHEYTRPRLSGETTGYPLDPGVLNRVYKYTSGRVRSEFVATDTCDWYAKQSNTNDRVRKCTVRASAGTPGAVSPYAPGDTYCLGNHLSDCNQYTIPVGAVDVCAGLTSSDNAWETTVTATESEYVAHVYPVGGGTCTTNCTGTVGYKLTKEVMCDGNVRTNTVDDKCSSATAPSNVTCATGYAYQQCTPVDSRASVNSYSGCFPDPLNGKYAFKDEIVPVSLAADNDYLYYCKVSDCNVASCWVNETVGGTPYYNDGNGCWGRVSVQGLQGENGKSCFVTNDGTNWNMCCSPTYAGNDCSIITDDNIINKLNGMMCQVNYTHKYLHDDGNGGFTANTTKDGARGERVIVTNSCNADTENLDTYYGEDGPAGDDYDPCDGLTAGSTAALTTVRNTTNVYVPHGNGSNGTTTGIGYYTETNVMCDTSGNKIVKKYDKCDPVSLASGASRTVGGKTCSGNQTLLMCTPQEEPTTPYYVCSDAEVSGYPKKKYFAPTVLDGKITKEGYTAWMHKYTSNGDEIEGDLADKDECHTVYKLARTNTSVSTVTTTTQTTRKCNVQSYEYPSPSSPWTLNREYCLNTDANGNCDGYSDNISDSETSTLKYHLPTMSATDSAIPIRAGYTYYEVKDGNNVTVREIIKEKDKCEEKILGRNASSNINNSAVVTQCTVVAPAGTPGLDSTYTAGVTYCLGYANGTCPSGLTDIGSAIDAAADAETDPCADVAPADKTKTVKSTTVEQTARSNSAPRTTTTTRTMCAGDPQVDINYEKCKPVIPTPVGKTCSNGVWMQCSGSASGEPDGYCETNAVITYVAPVVNDGIPGYLHTVITRNGQTTFVNDQGDKCEPVIGSVTTRASQSTTVYSGYKCTCGGVGGVCGQTGDMYYLGDIVGHESDATFKDLGQIYEQASESDPCTGLDSEDAAKTVKKTEYEYVAKGATGNNTGVGYVKKTKIMCDDTLTIPHKEEEILYDTCEAVKNDNTCLTIVGPNYQCYNQTKNVGDSERAYKTCNPNANVDSILVANKIDEKLNKDITFEVKQNSQDGNKDYITITGTNMTDKPVVALESLQGQSVFDIWKEEQTENAKCQALFDKNCSELTTSDMLLDLSAQGNWARSEYGKNPSLTHADLGGDDFQESLKPCKTGITITPNGTDASGGNKYTMTCTE